MSCTANNNFLHNNWKHISSHHLLCRGLGAINCPFSLACILGLSKTRLFCHVYSTASGFKIVTKVIRIVSIAIINSGDWQPSGLLIPVLKS